MRRRTGSLIALLLVVTALTLSGCTTIHVDSPVGTWIADGDDHGTLRVDADGTFVIDSASFDITSRQPSRSEFDGAGNWRLTSDGENILLEFASASLGEVDLQTQITLERSFRNGTILFEDPEQTGGITFRLHP